MLISELIEELYCLNPIRQIAAISELKDLEDKRAIPDLIKLLSSPEEDIRWSAIEALAAIADPGDESTSEALMKMLLDSSSLIRCDTLYALLDLDYKPAKKLAKDLLINDSEWLVRVAAAEALSYLADKGELIVISALEIALDDPSQPVRSFAACAIGILGIPEPMLINKLEVYLTSEESLSTKAEIMGAMYRLGVEEYLLKILKLLTIGAEEEFSGILNTIDDLVSRETPDSMLQNTSYIHNCLYEFSDKNVQFRHKCEKIIVKIGALNK
jgi:HEAT repeat protein